MVVMHFFLHLTLKQTEGTQIWVHAVKPHFLVAFGFFYSKGRGSHTYHSDINIQSNLVQVNKCM